jgi:hypothetical protein
MASCLKSSQRQARRSLRGQKLFVGWYSTEHRHSRLRSVTTNSATAAILVQRQALYEHARAAHPERWSGATRDWTLHGAVTPNPVGAVAQQLAATAA